MRILFYLPDTGAGYLARALAADLERTVGVEAAAAVIRKTASRDHVRRGTSLFEPFISEPEIFGDGRGPAPAQEELRELEARYGAPTLWQYVTMERYLSMTALGGMSYRYGTDRSRAQLLGYVVHGLRSVERMFDSFRPDAVVYCGVDVGSSVALMVDRVARDREVPLAVPVSTRVGGYTVINDTIYSSCSALEARYQALRAGQAQSPHAAEATRRLADLYHGRNELPHLHRNEQEATGGVTGRFQAAKAELASLARGVKYRSWTDFRIPPPHRRMLAQRRVQRNRARILTHDLFVDHPRKDERYILCPLHVEPEMSQLLYAPFYTNQLEVVRNVAQSVPADTHLYVKDHPALLGVRSWSYYEKLVRIPNVTLVRPTAASTALIKGARGVITITGTAALEAVFMGRPALTLGETIFSVDDALVPRVSSPERLPQAIAGFDATVPDPKAQHAYVSASLDVGGETSPFHLCSQSVNRTPEHIASLPGYSVFVDLVTRRLQTAYTKSS